MTRILSELLQAREPAFRQDVSKLEAAHGGPATDIRLTTEILQTGRLKLRELGLDSNDTTAEEAYHAFAARLKADDARLEKTLRTLAATYVSAEGNVVAGMVHALKQSVAHQSAFAVKATVVRGLLKKQPPKRAMKHLGYRSLDSMLKHESIASLLTAALLLESPAWRRSWSERYKALSARDFESRTLSIVLPSGRKWESVAASIVAVKKHNVVSLKELGAVVLLPLPADRPSGSVTATLTLALHALNDIRAASSFLKLSQMRSDFGRIVQLIASGEPQLQAHLLDQSVPWQLIQRYYTRAKHLFDSELFEPYLQLEDMGWHEVEHMLSRIEPSFEFWQGTAHIGLVTDGQPVSCNLLDVALNHCNKLAFRDRILHYGRDSLWHELMLRYLKHDVVEQAVVAELQPALAQEEVLL